MLVLVSWMLAFGMFVLHTKWLAWYVTLYCAGVQQEKTPDKKRKKVDFILVSEPGNSSADANLADPPLQPDEGGNWHHRWKGAASRTRHVMEKHPEDGDWMDGAEESGKLNHQMMGKGSAPA
jgi:hypothetical protein